MSHTVFAISEHCVRVVTSCRHGPRCVPPALTPVLKNSISLFWVTKIYESAYKVPAGRTRQYVSRGKRLQNHHASYVLAAGPTPPKHRHDHQSITAPPPARIITVCTPSNEDRERCIHRIDNHGCGERHNNTIIPGRSQVVCRTQGGFIG